MYKTENRLPVNEKKPLFACALTPILQDKKQTDNQNQNIFQKEKTNSFLSLLKLKWPKHNNFPENYSEIDAILA